MKMPVIAVLLSLLAACGGSAPEEAPEGGAPLDVMFDERHGLQGGEPVRFHDFEVGRVASVDLAGARVRARLSIDPEVLSQLTTETTFSVEEGDSGTFLLAHVLDPDAEKLAAGGSVEGVDSGIELALRQAGSQAEQLLERVGSSEWMKEAKSAVSEAERQVNEVDWGEKEREVKSHLEQAQRDLERAAGDTADGAKEAYRALREQMQKIAEELRELGRSEEAKRLEEQIQQLFGGGSGEPDRVAR